MGLSKFLALHFCFFLAEVWLLHCMPMPWQGKKRRSKKGADGKTESRSGSAGSGGSRSAKGSSGLRASDDEDLAFRDE